MAGAVRVTDAEVTRFARTLRRSADGQARLKELRKEFRAIGKLAVPAIRSAIRSLPSKGESRRRGRRSLRAEMARAVTLQVRVSGRSANVSVFMSPKKMPSGKKALPGYFEQVPGKTRLRHPVFGNREVWVQNQNVPPQGYFTRTVRPLEDNAVRAMQAVVERLAREIESE